MLGVVIAAHGRLAQGLVETAELICGKPERVEAIALLPGEGIDDIRSKVRNAVQKLSPERKALILIDAFGGTPGNACCTLGTDYRVEVVAGVNLPMVLELPSLMKLEDLGRMARRIEHLGKRAIRNVGQALKSRIADDHSDSECGMQNAEVKEK